jgi:HK97 family phage major capsid protein
MSKILLERAKDRQQAALAKAQAVTKAAEADKRDLTEEESAQHAAALAEHDTAKADAERYERAIAAAKAAPGRPIEKDWPGEPQANVGNAKPAFVKDPKKGFETPREFLMAVMQNRQPGSHVTDERLKFLATAGSDEQGGYSDPYGGFLVPTGFIPTLLETPVEGDPTAALVQTVPMATSTVEIPARTDKTHTSSVSGGLVVYRRSEALTATASRMSMEQVKLSATSLTGLSYATEELLTDSAISFAAILERGFRDEFASKILYEKLHGTGAGTLEGVINAAATVSVAKETGQAADTITYQNVVKMRARCWGYGRAIWLYNQDALPQLMQMYMPIGTAGVAMWQNSAREGEPDMLLGRPAYPTEYCASIGDTGDIILGNWSEYLYGVRQQLESAESLHVRFEYNERTFRFSMRNAGACWWRAALTPKKSSTTLSPFVKLDAR